MNTILVPTDFSRGANKALDFAIQIARAKGANIILLHVCELWGYGFFNLAVTLKDFQDETVTRLLGKLYLLKKGIEAAERIEVEVMLYNGSFTESVNEVVKNRAVSMVVMGTIGEGKSLDTVTGSKVAALIRLGHVPVLAIPPEYEPHEEKRIIVAVKEERDLPDYYDLIFEFVDIWKAELEIVNCSEAHEEAFEVMHDARVLHKVVDEMHAKNPAVGVQWAHLNGEHFERVLFDHLKDHPCDLLVLMSYHRRWSQYLAGRSASQRMVQHSYTPLLVLPSLS